MTTDYYTSLAIIESTTGEINNQLTMERAERVWHWGHNSENILFLLGTGTYESKRKVGIYSIDNDKLRTLKLPETLAMKQIRDVRRTI
jgi:hypothetical protein